MPDKNIHLGDGLYVKFNGYGFELSVNDHRNPAVAHFEPHHINKFKEFKDQWEEERKRLNNS